MWHPRSAASWDGVTYHCCNILSMLWMAAWHSGNSVGHINEVTRHRTWLVLRWVIMGIPSWYVTSRPGQLSLLPLAGQSSAARAAKRVTIGLASHRPWITDSVVCPPTGSCS